jgi:hypothetical protein
MSDEAVARATASSLMASHLTLRLAYQTFSAKC